MIIWKRRKRHRKLVDVFRAGWGRNPGSPDFTGKIGKKVHIFEEKMVDTPGRV